MPTFLAPVGVTGPAANGGLTVGTNTTTNAGGLWFGTDVNLYRSAADTLKTDDNFIIGGTSLTANGYNVIAPAQALDDTNEPSGFEDRTLSTIALVDNGADYTFTITPTSGSFIVWVHGVRMTKTAESLTIAKTTGSKFIYYNSAGVLTQSTTPWSLFTDTPIALIYYSATAGTAIMCEERHGCVMDASTHNYLHGTRGAQLGSGLALGDYTVTPGTPLDAHNRWSLSSGTVMDEDIIHSLPGLAAGGPYTVMRRTGATEWTWSSENDPFLQVAGNISYNSLSGGNWGQTAVPNHDFCNYWVFSWGTTAAATQTLVVQGQNFYTTLALAQAATIEANLDISLYPFIETVARYQITMRREDSYSTTGNCRIEAVTQLIGRSLAVSGQLSASNHATLSNRSLADQHPASSVTNTPAGSLAATDVQSALNELDTEKAALTGAALTGTYAFTLPATTTDAITSQVTGDAVTRYVHNADGSLQWGDGTSALDTNLYRSAADTLKTDDGLHVGTYLGVNAAPSSSYRLLIAQATSHTSGGGPYSFRANHTWTPAADATSYVAGSTSIVTCNLGAGLTHTNNAGEAVAGLTGQATMGGDGTYVTSVAGVMGYVAKSGAGNLSTARSFFAFSPGITGGTITNSMGLDIGAQKVTGVTNGYGIYQRGANDMNYFAGPASIGTAPTVNAFLHIAGTSIGTATTAYGFTSQPTFNTAATTAGNAAYFRVFTAASAFTMASAYGLNVAAPSIGATSAITTAYGLNIADQKITGVTNAYGIYQSGASTFNYFQGCTGIGTAPNADFMLYVAGTTPGTGASSFGAVFGYTAPTTTTGIAAGMQLGAATAAGSQTTATLVALRVVSPTKGAGTTVNNAYGATFNAVTPGTNNYTMSLAASSTATLWVGSGADDTTANAGIHFGTSRDTNLYRSAANTLKTDDAFVVGGASLTFADATNLVVDSTTGTKIGTASTQKLGWWNATPVVQPAGWGTPSGTIARTTYATSTATLTQVAERLGALITDLKTIGLLGA